MFSNDSYIHELYQLLLGENVHWQDREAWIFSKGVYTRYPFQGALHGLPADVIKECLLGAIEARLGRVNGDVKRPNTNGNSSMLREETRKSGAEGCTGTAPRDCCGDGILESTAELLGTTSPTNPQNFEEFIYANWGAGIAKHFAIPYNRKLWAVPLTEMETSWIGGRVPVPALEAMIDGALKPVPKPMGPNARFGYPLRGGFQSLMDAFLPHLKGDLLLNSSVRSVSPQSRTVTLQDGTQHGYSHLISTMPLPKLI